MANLFAALPAPAANGSGAAVDVSAYGAKKTITVSGNAGAQVTIEMSNELVPLHWAPVVGFNQADDKTLDIAARWMRATVSGYDVRSAPPAPVVNLAGNDDGATAAELVAPAGDGDGAAVDVSLLPEFKTVHVADAFRGAVQVQISADAGVTWNTVMSFSAAGKQSACFTANRMRVSRNGVGPAGGGGLPLINIEATVPGGGGSGGAVAGQGAVTSQWTAIVDPALGSDVTGTFGNLERPYATIQGALDDIPDPVDAATARRAYTVLVSPGTYDEDLTVDLTGGKHVALASWGPWNLGLFDAADWQPSNARSIAITTTSAAVFDNINGAFSIQSMMPPWTGDETQVAQVQAPRISGQITMTGLFAATPSIDVSLQAVVYGVANAAIVGGAEAIVLRTHRSRMRGTVVGAALTLENATDTRFDDALDILGYGHLSECFFGDGMTVVGVAPISNTVPGFYDCQVTGVFSGLAGSYYFDLVTSYWFTTNACAFAGGATRTLVEESGAGATPAVIFDDAVLGANLNIRSDRALNQSPIDNTKSQITNLGSADGSANPGALGATGLGSTIGGGNDNSATGDLSTVPGGAANLATGVGSFASGFGSDANGDYSSASNQSFAYGVGSHSSGEAFADGINSNAQNYANALGEGSHAEGHPDSEATADYSHTEGAGTTALGADYSHAEGHGTVAANCTNSHAEGIGRVTNGALAAHAEGNQSVASASYAHAQGEFCTAAGTGSHAEGSGSSTTVAGTYAHAEGGSCVASAAGAHAEGEQCTASGAGAHAEGGGCVASGANTHAQGQDAAATRETQFAHGGTSGAAAGRRQASWLVLYGATPGVATNENTTMKYGQAAVAAITLEDLKAYNFTVTAIVNGKQVGPVYGTRTIKKQFNARSVGGAAILGAAPPADVTFGDVEGATWTLTETAVGNTIVLTFDTGGGTASLCSVTCHVEFQEVLFVA